MLTSAAADNQNIHNKSTSPFGSMVEQTDARECHGDAILVARIDDVVVADRNRPAAQ